MSLFDRLDLALAAAAESELLPGDLDFELGGELREAAVLVAITERAQPGLLLTERHVGLRNHAGQVAFPGGRIDPGETATQAALREAWEELGIDPAAARIVGEIDHYRTVTGFGVTPVVAVIPPDLKLNPNPDEVDDWFEAPLAFLLDPANHRPRSAAFRGAQRRFIEINWNGRQIWGATAAMLVNLSRRLRWS